MMRAREFAGQLFNALRAAGWSVISDVSDKEPIPRQSGLCMNSGTLEEALSAAGLTINCAAGNAADGRLYILVGHRPVALEQPYSYLIRFSRWPVRITD